MPTSPSCDKLRTIRLYGILGATFGREFRLAVSSASEAIRALNILLPGFERFLNTSQQRGLTYAVFSGKRNLVAEELGMDHSEEAIRIAPVIIGSKRAGVLQTILGAVLVVAGGVITYFGGGAIGVPIMKLGASVALGGVIQMLSPQAGGLARKQATENQASYAFGGVTNTISQGYPVPLMYGQRRIGGAIISAGIYVEDQQ
ncbi:tail assembly protein [Shimwellia blattae]|uniref:Bacteriophage tail assembly protein I n=1 Tax=Shimwellia blattae (strain ATCC 29907 / DSM 4481 / JCM 1650 / NBRC 105725 / CDC 9005-74) TaxID=630626 RepID=I2B9C7_SHIBC|nr:tail assembly protein [Shimwellia blattae]AFJ47131.1 bacteriophage tail assembly protein I [Shimwellia blattae DSM 4481 = NBRC 105725]GAB80749.1 putative phage lambda tail assembly protein [Shimwellia blattae DSM 4481 = NBRC 105725]VDY64624.1 Phage-related protein, tail component [Shimwellia blattae]VEC22731.1 Phage-related protein, tail component [Shimwellia blattae]